jgi:hypothetical protein
VIVPRSSLIRPSWSTAIIILLVSHDPMPIANQNSVTKGSSNTKYAT